MLEWITRQFITLSQLVKIKSNPLPAVRVGQSTICDRLYQEFIILIILKYQVTQLI